MFYRLGATYAQVHERGFATLWRTRAEAETAKARLAEIGLTRLELFPDGGAYAVMGMF